MRHWEAPGQGVEEGRGHFSNRSCFLLLVPGLNCERSGGAGRAFNPSQGRAEKKFLVFCFAWLTLAVLVKHNDKSVLFPGAPCSLSPSSGSPTGNRFKTKDKESSNFTSGTQHRWTSTTSLSLFSTFFPSSLFPSVMFLWRGVRVYKPVNARHFFLRQKIRNN